MGKEFRQIMAVKIEYCGKIVGKTRRDRLKNRKIEMNEDYSIQNEDYK